MSWQRIEQTKSPGERKDIAGLLGQELRTVFSVSRMPHDVDGLQRLLEQIEVKRKRTK
ncbi:MAG TPA: hypothetical protein VKA03_00535 [Methylovirgula sp.]|nr:hypothetical protein [Methylovirgula sp.]